MRMFISMNATTKNTLLACFLASVGLTACSFEFSIGGDNLNSRRLNDFLESEVEAQTGLSITDVSCPEPRPIQEGDVFDCEKVKEEIGTVPRSQFCGCSKGVTLKLITEDCATGFYFRRQ